MQKKFVNLQFYETYYYVNIVHNIIGEPAPYVRGISEWYEDNEESIFLPAFPKSNRLQGFAAHIIAALIEEQISDEEIDRYTKDESNEIWVDRALAHHGIASDGFKQYLKQQSVTTTELNADHLDNYYQELWFTGELETLVEHLSKEVFHVLFSNRKFLSDFNSMLAGVMQFQFHELPLTELGKNLKKSGVLKRVKIPTWVKRAVFFRDRGMCSSCQKDLSGLCSAQPDSQYDHIIPLAKGGLNDVTNIQLLCQPCNGSKSCNIAPVSSIYESWY